MAKTIVSRRKADRSPAHDPKDLSHIKSAADQIDEAIRAMRIAGSMFGQDGLEQSDPRDVRHVVGTAMSAMEQAADDLVSLHHDSPADRSSQPTLVQLYDLIDVANVLSFALAGGEFPPKNATTCSPTAGTISVVGSRLPALRAKLIRFLDKAPPAARSRKSTAPAPSADAQVLS